MLINKTEEVIIEQSLFYWSVRSTPRFGYEICRPHTLCASHILSRATVIKRIRYARTGGLELLKQVQQWVYWTGSTAGKIVAGGAAGDCLHIEQEGKCKCKLSMRRLRATRVTTEN